MSEQYVNPYDSDNFGEGGGGLWDGKTVTITSAKAIQKTLDGFIDDKTGKPVVKNLLEIRGVADGEDTERWETYSVGSLVPTPDGDGFVKADGTPGIIYKTAEASKFFDAVKAGGFNVELLFDKTAGRSKLSAFVGAKFVFAGVEQKGQDGKVKKNKKGYNVKKFFPVKFVGKATGNGNGAVTNNSEAIEALRAKATENVLAVLAESEGNTITRTDLIRKLSARLAGDADSPKVIALIAREEFHKTAPWKRDGASYSL